MQMCFIIKHVFHLVFVFTSLNSQESLKTYRMSKILFKCCKKSNSNIFALYLRWFNVCRRLSKSVHVIVKLKPLQYFSHLDTYIPLHIIFYIECFSFYPFLLFKCNGQKTYGLPTMHFLLPILNFDLSTRPKYWSGGQCRDVKDDCFYYVYLIRFILFCT